MAETTNIKIVGLEQYAERLRNLPGQISSKMLTRVSAAGAKVLRELTIEKAPVAAKPHWRRKGQLEQPGTIKRAVYSLKIKELTNNEQAVYYVSVRKGKREQKRLRDAYYWTWVEFGHISVRRGKTGNSKGLAVRRREAKATAAATGGGKVGAVPFLSPAQKEGGQPALMAMEQRLSKEWDKYLKESGGYRQK